MSDTWALDSGRHFQQVAIDKTNQFMVAIVANESSNNTVVYSRDFGATWTPSTGITGNVLYISSNGIQVVACVSGQARLYYSETYGVIFNELGASPITYWSTIHIDNNGNMAGTDYVDGTSNIYSSPNGGYSWSTLYTVPDVAFYKVAASERNQLQHMYLVGFTTVPPYYTGVFMSHDNGSTWNSIQGISEYNLNSITCDETGKYVFVTASQDGVYRSTNYGSNWEKTSALSLPPSGPNMGPISCDVTGNHVMAMDIENRDIYVSTNRGDTWIQQGLAGNDAQVTITITGLSMSPSGSHSFALFEPIGTYSCVKSEWKTVNFSSYAFRPFTYVASSTDCDNMVAIAYNQYGYSKCLVYSADNGLTWQLSNADASGDSQYVCLATSSSCQYVVVGVNNGIFSGVLFSSDYGVTYTLVTTGFNFIPSAVAVSESGAIFYATTSDNTGVIYVGNMSGDVVVKNMGIPNMFWNSIACSTNGQYVYATSQGSGTDAKYLYKAYFGTPYTRITMNNDTTDVMNNTVMSMLGSPNFVSGYATPMALELANTAGSTATNYLLGPWTGSNNFTMSMWFNLQSSGAVQTLFSAYGTALYLYTNSSNELVYSFPSGGGTNNETIYGPTITTNVWYYVNIIFQTGGLCSLYLNNTRYGSYTNVGGLGTRTTTHFAIGTYDVDDYGQALNGYVSDFKLYQGVNIYDTFTEIPQFTSTKMCPLSVISSGSGDKITVSAGTDGIYQSNDNGLTWTQKNSLTASTIDQELLMVFNPIQPDLSINSWKNNNVSWTSSASTFMTGQDPFIPFKDLLDNSWNTTSNTYTLSGNSSGIMNTFYTNGTDTLTVEGDWLQLKSSTPLIISSYEIGCGNANNLPTMFYIVGSNDETNWYALQYASAAAKPFDAIYQMVPGGIILDYSGGQAWGSTILTTTSYSGSSNAYTYFRMIVLSSFYAPGTCAQIGKWLINFLPTRSPMIHLPLTGTVFDDKNASFMTTTGSTTYLAGQSLIEGINLANNNPGLTPTNYIRSTITSFYKEFTVSFQFNVQSFTTNGQPIIFGLGNASNTIVQLVLYDNQLSLQVFGTSATWSSSGMGNLTADTWYTVFIRIVPFGRITVFLNDIEQDNITFNVGGALYAPMDTLTFGTYTHEVGGAYNGYVRDFKMNVEGKPYIRLFGNSMNDLLEHVNLSVYGTITSPPLSGFDTYALRLDNNTDNAPINYVRGTFDHTQYFTIDLSFNMYTAPNTGGASSIFTMGTSNDTSLKVQYCNNANLFDVSYFTGLVVWFYDLSNNPIVVGTIGISNNEWYRLRIIFGQSLYISAYLNEDIIGSASVNDLHYAPNMYTFGSDCHDAVNAYDGHIADFRVYGTALHAPIKRNITMIAGDSGHNNLVVADVETQTVFRSSNAGDSWTGQIIQNPYQNEIINVSFDSSGTYAFACYDSMGAVMSQRSTGLTTNWTTLNGKYYSAVTFSNNNERQSAMDEVYDFGTTYNRTAYSSDSGVTWTTTTDLGEWTSAIAADSTGQYVVTVLEKITPSVYRSTDYGATYTELSNSPDYDTYGVNCIACDSTGNRMYVGAYNGDVFYSSDAGVNWTSYSLSDYVFSIACSHDGQYVYALYGNLFAYSTDYAATWTTDINISSYGLNQVACDWSGQYVVVSCGRDGIYRSTDYGQTWTKTSLITSLDINNQYYLGLACNSTGNRIITMDANNAMLYISLDAGATWQAQYTPGSLSNETAMGVSISPDGTVYLANFWAPGSYRLVSGSPDIPSSVPCFLEGTKILCQVNGVEEYKAVETIRPGMLVKTSRDGFKPVKLIGSRSMNNAGTADRHKNSLYVCTKSKYPELTEDLTITGCHAILVDKITDAQRAGIIQTLERVFVTDRRYRLPACVDERTEVLQTAGQFTVWHFALEHYDTRMNFGVYAQGLLVESSPICHMNSKNYHLVQ